MSNVLPDLLLSTWFDGLTVQSWFDQDMSQAETGERVAMALSPFTSSGRVVEKLTGSGTSLVSPVNSAGDSFLTIRGGGRSVNNEFSSNAYVVGNILNGAIVLNRFDANSVTNVNFVLTSSAVLGAFVADGIDRVIAFGGVNVGEFVSLVTPRIISQAQPGLAPFTMSQTLTIKIVAEGQSQLPAFVNLGRIEHVPKHGANLVRSGRRRRIW